MPVTTLAGIPRLFHFTDRRNLLSIRQHGGIFAKAELDRLGIAIAAAGGNQWSFDADKISGMDIYVHLCLMNEHPMEYVARQEGRIKDSIFLEIDPSVMLIDGVQFTSDVSNKSDIVPVPVAMAEIDFEVVYSRTDWKNPDIQERRRQAKKCEILIPRMIPLRFVRNPNG